MALGPAVLLLFEAGDFRRELGGGEEFGEENELPAAELGAVGEIDIFGESVVLPAAGIFDGLFAPSARGAVEVDETSGAVAGGMFDHEVAVEEDGLATGEHGLGTVEVRPAASGRSRCWGR